MNTSNQPFVLLLAEDEEADAKLFKWALAENRIQVNFHHVSDGCEALEFLRRLGPRFLDAPRPDLILLDIGMPRMGGMKCLAAIKQDKALCDIPVVMLSTSHADSDVFACHDLGAADYFTKPMDLHHLVGTIRALANRWITPDVATEKESPVPMHHTVKVLESLPALPRIAHKILSIELSTDKGDAMLLKLVKKDPAIFARIIGLANSSQFGASRKIMTADEAAVVLGMNRIKMVALSFAMISSLRRKPPGLLDETGLWKHSMAVALAMDELSMSMPKKSRPPEEDIYLAGLLHDIGFLVLDHIDPKLSDRLHKACRDVETRAKAGSTSLEIEAGMLELNHSELGALLAKHWGLSEDIVAVLRNHHSEGVAQDAVGQPLIAMTSLAERLLPMFAMDEHMSSDINVDDWLALGIAAERVDEVKAAMLMRAEIGTSTLD